MSLIFYSYNWPGFGALYWQLARPFSPKVPVSIEWFMAFPYDFLISISNLLDGLKTSFFVTSRIVFSFEFQSCLVQISTEEVLRGDRKSSSSLLLQKLLSE